MKKISDFHLLKNNDELIVKGIMIMVMIINFCGILEQQKLFNSYVKTYVKSRPFPSHLTFSDYV